MTNRPRDPRNPANGWPRGLRARLLPSCREMSRHLSLRRELEVPWSMKPGMLLHQAMCSACRRYARQVRWIGGLGAAEPPGTGLPPGSKDRLRRALRAGPGASSQANS